MKNNEVSYVKNGESVTFARDVVWVGIAQLLNAVIFGIATLPALTKNYGSEIFGIWAQILVTISLMSPFFAMELDMSVVRFLSGEEDKVKRRKAFGAMLFAIVFLAILAFAVINLVTTRLSVFLFASPQYVTFVQLTFLWVIVDAFFIFLCSYFRARKKIKLLSIRQVIYSTVVMVVVFTLTAMGLNLEWVVGTIIVVEGVLSLIFFFMIVREIGWPWPNFEGLKGYLAFSLPQIPGVALLWLVASSDRYFITHLLNLSQAGIYSSSSQLAGLTRIFYTPICYVLYPSLSRLWDQNRFSEVRNYLQNSTRLLLTLGIPATVGIALLSQPVLDLLTTSEFLAGNTVVFFISLGSVFLGIFQINSQIILLLKKTNLLPLIIASASFTSVLLNIILIPRIGIVGAGISNVAAYFVLAAIAVSMARKSTNFIIDVKSLFKIFGATVPMAAWLYFFKVDSIWTLVLAIIVGILIYILGLLVLRAFSGQDIILIRKTVGSLMHGPVKRTMNTGEGEKE